MFKPHVERSLTIAAILLLASAGCSKIWITENSPAAVEARQQQEKEERLEQARAARDQEISQLQRDLRSNRPARSGFQQQDRAPDTMQGPVFVEVLWRVPQQEVTAYHLYYGTTPRDLKQHIRVPVTQLERFNHPSYGETFRYKLEGMSPRRTTYVSIQAENNSGLSPRSPELRIPPVANIQ